MTNFFFFKANGNGRALTDLWMEGDPVAQLLCDFLRQIEPQPWGLLGQVAIVAGEAPLKDAEDIAIFDPNPLSFI